jgi:hypothetical protein
MMVRYHYVFIFIAQIFDNIPTSFLLVQLK